jgi:hypothetical protein
MMDQTMSATSPEHPSPHRERVNLALLLFGVFAGPVAWSAQLVANYILAVDPCFLTRVVRTEPVLRASSDWPAILIVNLVAALLAIAGGIISLRLWRESRHEHPGTASHAVEVGEGRTRFLALWGVMTGFGFLAAILFDTIALFLVPRCSG